MTVARLLIASLLAALFCCPRLGAQAIRIVQPPPDCRVFRVAAENPFSDSKLYVQRRVAWHIEKATAGALATTALEHIGVPRRIAALTPALFTIALHIRGIVRRTYALNPMDWLADAWMVSPAAMRPTTWLVGYAVLDVCWASP